jgi:hypothetical protein
MATVRGFFGFCQCFGWPALLVGSGKGSFDWALEFRLVALDRHHIVSLLVADAADNAFLTTDGVSNVTRLVLAYHTFPAPFFHLWR